MVMQSSFAHGRALVMGVGHDLPITVADAQGVAKLLSDPARCGYPPGQVELLCGPKATRANILAGLERLAKLAGPEDTVIVYFSGHGAALPDFHLVPFGYDPADLPGTAISEAELGARLRAIGAGRLAVFLDCCHAAGQASAKAGPSAALPPAILDEFRQGQGRVILASSRFNEISFTGAPYSVFTRALLEGLSGCGASQLDGYARLSDVALWVGSKVPERTGDQQHPVFDFAKADNFALAWYAAGSKSPLPLDGILPPESPVLPASMPTPTPPSLPGRPTGFDRARATRRLDTYRESLGYLEDRMAQFVLSTDVPLQLLKERDRLQRDIAELEAQLGQTAG